MTHNIGEFVNKASLEGFLFEFTFDTDPGSTLPKTFDFDTIQLDLNGDGILENDALKNKELVVVGIAIRVVDPEDPSTLAVKKIVTDGKLLFGEDHNFIEWTGEIPGTNPSLSDVINADFIIIRNQIIIQAKGAVDQEKLRLFIRAFVVEREN